MSTVATVTVQTTTMSTKARVIENNNDLDSGFESIERSSSDSLDSVDSNSSNCSLSLESSYRQLRQCSNLFFANKFDEAFEFTKSRGDKELPAAHAGATFNFLFALLTLESKHVEDAKKAIKKDLNMLAEKRKQHSIGSNISKLFFKMDYDQYSDEECIAEAHYAESLVMLSLLTFFGHASVYTMVKGALRLAAANNSINLTAQLDKNKKNWDSDFLRRTFQNNVSLIAGTSNLILSHLPPRVLKVLSLVGVHGSRDIADNYLQSLTTQTEDIRFEPAAMIIMAYNIYLEQIFGVHGGDLDWAQQLAELLINKHPGGLISLWFLAKIKQVRGKPDEAVKLYQSCLDIKTSWRSIHNICYWDMSWCFALQRKWALAAKYAKLMESECKWSQATNLYQWATFNFQSLKCPNDNERGHRDAMDKGAQDKVKDGVGTLEEVEAALEKVPSLRKRFGGKTISAERFAIEKSQLYFEDKSSFLLPAYELFYAWNIFSLASGDESLLQPIIDDIDSELIRLEKEPISSVDNKCLLLLLKGVCLKYLKASEAIHCLREVIESEKKLPRNSYLIPHATLELGLAYLKSEQFEDAAHWIEKSRSDYTHRYQMENLVHLRAHSAMRLISENAKKTGDEKID